MEIDEKDVLDAAALNELYLWLDAASLSRPKRNIARDFSDGVLVAEIIHYYLPRAVDLHNYVVASSIGQKIINWNTLNRKVFSKMGIKLNDSSLNQVVEAKPGAIEQVLWDLRSKIIDHANVHFPIESKRELTYTRSTSKVKPSIPSSHSVKDAVIQKKSALKVQDGTNVNSRPPIRVHTNPSSFSAAKPYTLSKIKSSTNAVTSRTTLKVTESKEKSKVSDEDRKSLTQINGFTTNGNPVGAEVPSQIVYRGHKMVPVELLDLKDKEMKEIENSKKLLITKIDRLEKLVQIKDNRIEDLSNRLANTRSMYEHVTQATFSKIAGENGISNAALSEELPAE